MIRSLVVLSGMVLGACTDGDDLLYDRFNATGEEFSVEVGTETVGERTAIELKSSTGAVLVGSASVEPDAGPSGTLHLIEVQVEEDYVHQVDKVSVEIDAGDRGVQTYDLTGDSADESLYRIEIESVADDAETRTDVFEIQLWDVSGDVDE